MGSTRERLVVIGGDAAGMSAASQARRMRPDPDDLEIVALERGRWTSYSACGIPYLVGGDVDELDDLVARTPEEFRRDHHIDARTRQEVTSIDIDRQRVEVRDLDADETYHLDYDILHVATGAVPVRPDLDGIDHPDIHGVQGLEDAHDLLQHAERVGDGCRVVVVGGGYIGLEMAEAFLKRGASVTVVTRTDEPLGMFDPDMGALVARAMRDHGITVHTGTSATGFEQGKVHTTMGTLEADLVVLGLGVRPNADLAAAAGVATDPDASGAIVVDRRQRTNIDNVYAAGDCSESFHRLTGERVFVALGTVANKTGRVAGTNIGGGYATFPGVIGTAVTKLCALECARTGVNEREARRAGFETVSITVDSTTRAGYFPGAGQIKVKMLGERGSGRLLGAQILGLEGAAKRIDVVATAITAGLTVDQVTELDLSYAPPFSPLWDPVLITARKLAERL